MTLVLTISTIVNLSIWLLLTLLTRISKKTSEVSENKRITTLICSKNNAKNLSKHIPEIIDTLTTEDQVLIVNDFSTDESEFVIEKLISEYPQIRSLTPSKDIVGKKQAIVDGFNEVNSQFIQLTDSDCTPISNKWSQSHLNQIKNYDVILGYGPFIKENNWINNWQRWECAFIALQYMGFSKAGFAYMGVGRNIFLNMNVVKGINVDDLNPEIASGDDDFLIQYIQKRKGKITINLDPNSFFYSPAQKNMSDYIRQKKRHLSSSSKYPTHIKIMLSILPISHIIFWVLCAILCWSLPKLIVQTIVYRWFALYFLQFFNLKKFHSPDLWKFTAFFDIGLLLYYVYFSFSGLTNNKNKW